MINCDLFPFTNVMEYALLHAHKTSALIQEIPGRLMTHDLIEHHQGPWMRS